MGQVNASKMINLSIIIPVYKECDTIHNTLDVLKSRLHSPELVEIILVDHNQSTQVIDPTIDYYSIPEKGRAVQMNKGAEKAKSNTLYFLHADSLPPIHFDKLIRTEIDNGSHSGSFRMDFDKKDLFLKFFAWFTRFENILCSGGDQSLFVLKKTFYELGGFNADMKIMEDLDIVKRLKKKSNYSIVKKARLVTSSRKYEVNGVYRLQFLFTILHFKYRFGSSQEAMTSFYKKYIVSP